jgi:hypothetical protein
VGRDRSYSAEAVITNGDEDVGRGNGAFVRSKIVLAPEIGYRDPIGGDDAIATNRAVAEAFA